jgi:hypothetical protein
LNRDEYVTLNPYAPPTAEVADIAGDAKIAPPLWNPNAAANWSLLLTPAFGAFLHMRNWEALGEPKKALVAKTWFLLSVLLVAGVSLTSVMAPRLLNSGVQGIGVMLLFAWYFTGGRPQVSYVRTRFGKAYPRRGWLAPLASAVLMLIGLGFVVDFFAAALKVALPRIG